jgi:hypothetical protein
MGLGLMASQKRLSSVCHSIAHHAVSALSFIHPHLRQACRSNREKVAVIDLLADEPCPLAFLEIAPLRLALNTLKHRFVDILITEGFGLVDIKSAWAIFEFKDDYPDDFCSNCHAFLKSAEGKEFKHAVNYLGNSIVPNESLVPD